MPTDSSFVSYAVDLLSLVGPVQARAMFGGHGLYTGGVMFGLLDDGELFLKTDAQTRGTFVGAGCRQWIYVNKKVRMEETSYFRPPDEAHEDREAMLPWARLAVAAAQRARAARQRKSTRRSAARSLSAVTRSKRAARKGRAAASTRGRRRPVK